MFKILSLDGGGIRGIITACWLDKLRDELEGESLYKYFDLIVGTSTGSILASAVACDIVPKESSYKEFYQNYGERIFAKRRRVTASMMDWPLLSLFRPTYALKNLEDCLKEVFKEKDAIKSAKTKLFLTSYDVYAREPYFIKSYDPKTENILVWEACLSSSAAPAYFAANMLRLRNGAEKILVDGGVVANNPSACALAEAISISPYNSLIEANAIYLVSLGTGNLTRPIKKNAAQSWGSIQWMRPILDVVFDGSSASVDFICRQILPDAQFFRMQAELKGASDDLDDVTEENMVNLVNIAETYATSTYKDHGHGAREFKRIVDMLKSSKPAKN